MKTKQELMEEFELSDEEFEQYREFLSKNVKADSIDLFVNLGAEHGLSRAETWSLIDNIVNAKNPQDDGVDVYV
jgi:flagellar biosynthesis protein FliP